MRLLFLIVISILCFNSVILFAAEIHDAARDGDMNKLIMLAETDPNSLYELCSMGKTPLHWATGKGHAELITLLLERFKVPADIRNANNGTPLHVAASQARTDCAKILIEHGADLNARANDRAAPLHFACFKGQKQGHVAVVKLLLEKGCDINPEMKNRATPMNLALKRNNNEIIKILKKYNAKANKIDTSVKIGRYDFAGKTAYKKGLDNSEEDQTTLLQIRNSRQNRSFNNSVKALKNMSFSKRKQMMLKLFDKNKDGILDESERQQARKFMKNRLLRRIFD